MDYSCQVINVTLKLSFATKSDFRDTWRGVDTSAIAITDCAYKILSYLCPLPPVPPFFMAKEPLGKHTHSLPKPGSALSTFSIGVQVHLWSPPAPLSALPFFLLSILSPISMCLFASNWKFLTWDPPSQISLVPRTSFSDSKHSLPRTVCKPGVRRKVTWWHYSQFSVNMNQLTTTSLRLSPVEKMSLLLSLRLYW